VNSAEKSTLSNKIAKTASPFILTLRDFFWDLPSFALSFAWGAFF
jgi:hypothetical protein